MRGVVLALGPLLFAATVVFDPAGGLTLAAWRVAGLAAWMALWWLSAVVPLEATSLLPIVILPVAGAGSLLDVTARYADPIIFLFLGGFFLAATLERWDLHKRFALATVNLVGTDAPRVVLAFMLATAAASMWISNTATTIMMTPIAMAICTTSASPGSEIHESRRNFATPLLIGIAYAASIGGLTTLIGTPPNAIMAAAARDLAGIEITFGSWLPIGLSVSVPMLILCWLWLVKFFRVRGEVDGLADTLKHEHSKLGAMTHGERFVLVVFALTALAWVFRAPKSLGVLRIPGLTDLIPGISDTAIAVASALVLFSVPLRRARYRTALDWETAQKVPWGILLLFGGGLALARAFETSELTSWLGGRIEMLAGAPTWIIVFATAGLFVLMTELTSNAATTSLGMPLMVGVALGLGISAEPLMIAAALAASMAFMLPVATPPNAIVFGSRMIAIRDMAKAGIMMNVLAVLVITLIVRLWIL